ncbi:Ail/Lom family outer membrane beta-barrel protein [Escherichia coli]|uniref:Ail/Lom family outer membrane beta-barrel protein n=1 Tax=Escherichia coli TaxID=562 RepID=A0A6D0EW69_ECOLX|nr:Ail/Lom family outer membrane beta-barrel protein [Escherichia coli]MWL35345.1 Ail/Lom family outer membrane beta-barrel protein [Escherichia coli]MWL46184.1 Ail/Lom family outer membrane beta-barrel protein [Escherichia coli]MWM16900.1 Ail/Lom family outer membrane beta-barrel protein [Escherichia coli]MWM27170.1 Ail/Lom family outer membrane beta-barrel protein [Escherichia coli]
MSVKSVCGGSGDWRTDGFIVGVGYKF